MRRNCKGPIRSPRWSVTFLRPERQATCAPAGGFSLLEVILAIAILGISIAMIGELVNLGTRQAEEARELASGQLVCESKMAEIAAGVIPAEAVSMVPDENDQRWLYSVQTNTLPQENLIEVRVTVQQAESIRLQPLTFSLVSWMIDPSLALAESSAEETTEATAEEPTQASSQSASGTSPSAASGAPTPDSAASGSAAPSGQTGTEGR